MTGVRALERRAPTWHQGTYHAIIFGWNGVAACTLVQPAAAPPATPRRPPRQRQAARAGPGTSRATWRWTARGYCAARSRRTPRGALRRPRGARCRASRTRRRRCRCRPAWPTPGAARWPARSAARPRSARTCRAGAQGRPATHHRRLVANRLPLGRGAASQVSWRLPPDSPGGRAAGVVQGPGPWCAAHAGPSCAPPGAAACGARVRACRALQATSSTRHANFGRTAPRGHATGVHAPSGRAETPQPWHGLRGAVQPASRQRA